MALIDGHVAIIIPYIIISSVHMDPLALCFSNGKVWCHSLRIYRLGLCIQVCCIVIVCSYLCEVLEV